MKKFLTVGCCAVLAFSCVWGTSCGETGGADKGEFLGLKEGEEFTTDSKVSLTLTRPTGNDAQEKWWTNMIAAFNQEFSGRIEVSCTTLTRGNGREYEQNVSLQASSGTISDVLYLDGPFIATYANAGVIIPIDNYIYEGYTDDFLPYVNEQNTYNDRLYALSIVDSTVCLFYNKQILKQKNITVPTSIGNAWTFDDLKEIATSLTSTSGRTTCYGLQIAGDAGEWLSYAFTPLWTDGVIDSEGKLTTGYLDGAAGVEAGMYLRSLVKDKAVSASASGKDFSATTPLAAMALTGTQNISEYLALGDSMQDWGVTFYPADEDGKIAAPCGGWTLGITKNCSTAKRVAAAEFIKYCTSKEACESCARDTASPPSRLSLYNSMPEYSDGTNAMYPVYSIIKEQLLTSAQLRPQTVGYEVFSTQMSNAISNILKGTDYDSQTKIKDRLTTAAQLIDKSIAQITIY